jgi:predicted CoA-substrate-specific enzyme activase
VSRPAGIGIDAGSTSCKLVAAGPDGEIVDSILEPAHPRIEAQVDSLLEQLTARLGPIDDIPRAATGYGRAMVPCADRRVTEITCHARGVFRSLQRPGTLVDIGGQDAKVIRIGPEGRPEDFAMNDKCAAGTGRFLEHTAGRLGVEITDLGPRALAAEAEERITSTCTVFAESEIISLVAHGAEVDAILRGLHRSLVDRIVALIHSIGWTTPVLLSGGVALNDAVRVMLGEALAEPVRVANRPQLTGAHGAALLAIEG